MWVKYLLPVALLLLLAACAAGNRRARPPGEDVLVTVDNNLAMRTGTTVRMLRSDGSRSLLGAIPPGEIRTFRFAESAFTGRYRLLAQPDEGRDFTSPEFSLFPAATVRWDLRINLVTVR